jgi:hypothetical protein
MKDEGSKLYPFAVLRRFSLNPAIATLNPDP